VCRYEAVTRRPALLESTGETYAELASAGSATLKIVMPRLIKEAE
jgi:hypothetical protein